MKRINNQINLEECGAQLPGYEATFDFEGDFINLTHENLSKVSVRERGLIDIRGIFGFLFKQEALKLYELAYFCKGNILEIGTHQGLSAFLMAHAIEDSGRKGVIKTFDVHKGFQDKAIENITRKGFSKHVQFTLKDGLQAVLEFSQKETPEKFGLVFVDHDHTFEPNYNLCKLLDQVVEKGGFVLFHDYNDARNKTQVYGVFEAVNKAIDKKDFTFYGIVGSIAIYRRK